MAGSSVENVEMTEVGETNEKNSILQVCKTLFYILKIIFYFLYEYSPNIKN